MQPQVTVIEKVFMVNAWVIMYWTAFSIVVKLVSLLVVKHF